MSRAASIATITPEPEATRCEADGCGVSEGLATVDPDAVGYGPQTLCGAHRVEYFEELRA